MSCTKERFGTAADGREVDLYTLSNGAGLTVKVLNLGGIIQAILVPDRDGQIRDIALGYNNVGQYENNDAYFGAAIGRCANRIKAGRFTLNGREYPLAVNDPPNHLHGGPGGLHTRIFEVECGEDHITMRYHSPDGEEGYPGNLDITITYRLTPDNALVIEHEAIGDADTVVNLTNHTYFNLSGGESGDILDQTLKLNATRYTENDANCLPTGVIAEVAGTPFDFRTAKPIGRDIGQKDIQLAYGLGYDHNFVVDGEGLRPAAWAVSPGSGITLTVSATQPGIQFYSGNHLTRRPGKTGFYDYRGGFCLETQDFPNALECPNFPSPILKAGRRYRHTTMFAFGIEK